MTRTILLSGLFVVCCALAAHADDDLMAPFYGNTVIGTGGMADTHTNFNADHTFVTKVPAFGMSFKGTWELKGNTLCRTFETPPPNSPNPLCFEETAHKVGDTWTVTVNGNTRTATLVKGIQ